MQAQVREKEREKLLVDSQDRRWIAVSGLLFVAAWIVGVLVAAPPAANAPIADLIAYFEAHRAMIILQAYLANGLTGILLIVFAAALHSALRRSEGRSSTLASILLGAGIVVAGLSCVEALFMQVAANNIAVAGSDGAVLRTLLNLNAQIDTFKLPILAIMIGASSALAGQVRAWPRWLSWLGAVEAVLLVVASGSTLFPSAILTDALYASGIGLLLWAGAVSVSMGWRRLPGSVR